MGKNGYRIKQIILNGFKSFPFKTTIELSPAVTCIVGPNGCGKSNIADAIQWVLGEQKPTEVRLKEMSEVIFSGSKKRKPYSFAEVTILLKSNGLSEDIKISRKIYSSGESNYYINDKSVRLKDLRDFLNSENLNISSYSILGQGEIERVALLKPYEKKELIEECAGIYRFKEKQKITLLKLEDTEKNLELTSHLLEEQEKIAHSLRIQAGRAKSYEIILKEEEEILKLIFSQERDNYKREIKEIKEGILKEEEKRVYLLQDLKKIEEKIEELEKEEKRCEKEELILREENEKNLLSLQEINFKIEKDKEKIGEIEDKILGIEKEIALLEEEEKREKDSLKEKENSLKILKEEIEKLNLEISEGDKFSFEVEKIIKEKEDIYKNLLIPHQELQILKEKVSLEVALLKDRYEKIEETLSLEKRELKTFTEREKFVEREYLNHKKELLISEKGFKDLEEFTEKEKIKLEERNREIFEKEKNLEILKSELEKLEELKEREKKLLEESKRDEKSTYLFLKVPEELENIADLILEEIGISIISEEEYPNKEGYFVTPKFFEVEKIEGTVPIKEIISLKEMAPQWLLNSLPPIYYVEDEKNLKEISKKYPNYTFFDKRGRVAKGSFWGNPPYQKKGVLGSKIRLEILEEKIFNIIEKIKEEEISLKNLKDFFKRESLNLEEKLKEKHELSTKIINLKNREAQYETQLKNLRERLEELNNKIKELDGNSKEIFKEKEDKLKLLRDLIQREEKEKVEIEKIKGEIEEVKSKERDKQNFFQDKIKLLKEKEVERERIVTQIEGIKNIILKNQKRLRDLKREREENYKLKEEIIKEKENLLLKYLSLKEKYEEGKNNYEIKLNEREELYQENKNHQNKLKNHREKLDENFQKIQEYKTKEEILNLKLRELEEKTKEVLKIDLYTLPPNEEKDLKEKLEKIREKKERFGQVNPLAKEELEEILQKINFIKKQKEDLEESSKALKENLKGLEKEALKRFMEVLGKINENFQKYFKYLFNGGNAKIILQDEEDPLSSGIEILAEPPGKKVQHLLLLSGGERALVSLAFLLCLFETSPSPFIFFDEADAPLDDVNVERFLNLIKRLKNDFQVILITHNRRTMEEASLLLGVTMDEPGLSKILALNPKEVLKGF